jgi:hypothetical protein
MTLFRLDIPGVPGVPSIAGDRTIATTGIGSVFTAIRM